MGRLDSRGTVRLEHGSGGALSRELIEKTIYSRLKSSAYPAATDATVVNVSGPVCMTTDSYVVDPPFFPGGDIGTLAVNGTCNDLAVSGARPSFLTLSFIIEEGFSISDFESIVDSVAAAAAAAGVAVVTGDTKVVPRGKGGGIFVNTAGIGRREHEHGLSPNRLRDGDSIVVSGPLGAHGITILAKREGLPVGAALRSDCACLFNVCRETLSYGAEVRVIRDATRGGVAGVVNELARESGDEKTAQLGIELSEELIPVDVDVASAADLLGLSPLEIANEGVVVAVVAPETAEAVVKKMRMVPEGRGAAVIGRVTAEHPGQVWLRTEVGGHRLLDMPRGLLLPRIC